MINVLNGTLDLGIGEVQEILPQLQPGRCACSPCSTEKRLVASPDVPTAREQGVDSSSPSSAGWPRRRDCRPRSCRRGSRRSRRCSRSPSTARCTRARTSCQRSCATEGRARLHAGVREGGRGVAARARRRQVSVRAMAALGARRGSASPRSCVAVCVRHRRARDSAEPARRSRGRRGGAEGARWALGILGVVLIARALGRPNATRTSRGKADTPDSRRRPRTVRRRLPRAGRSSGLLRGHRAADRGCGALPRRATGVTLLVTGVVGAAAMWADVRAAVRDAGFRPDRSAGSSVGCGPLPMHELAPAGRR